MGKLETRITLAKNYKLTDLPETEQKIIIEAVKAWLEKLLDFYTTGHTSHNIALIDCPQCGPKGKIEHDERLWRCLNSCGFRFPTDFTPPGPDELCEIIKRIQVEENLKKILERIKISMPALHV